MRSKLTLYVVALSRSDARGLIEQGASDAPIYVDKKRAKEQRGVYREYVSPGYRIVKMRVDPTAFMF